MNVQILSPDSIEWQDHLGLVDHDAYHLPDYVGLEARRLGGEPVACLAGDGSKAVLVPLVLRPLPNGIAGVDAISPYGYPGPLLSREALDDVAFIRAAGAAIGERLGDMGCCAAFIRCHPLLPVSEVLFETVGTLRTLGPTVWIDLTLSEEERWAGMDKKARRSINLTQSEGYWASVDEDWEHFDRFLDLYWQTMNRVGAEDSYYFDKQYFEDLRHALGSRIHLVTVQRASTIVAASIFFEVSGIVQAHLSGAERLEGGLSADRVRLEYASDWFSERGNRYLHLGGGLGASSDSILRFKSGFSPERGSYSVWELVTNRELFDLACASAPTPHTADAVGVGSFFPPYRQE